MSDRSPHPLRLLYGEAAPPRLRRDNTALIVVDMQYFDAHPDWGHEQALTRMDGGPNVVVSTAEMTARLAELGLEPVPARREALAEHLAAPPPTPANGGPDDPYKLIFGEPPRPSLEPSTTALLLMDVQRLTADRSGSLWQKAAARGAQEMLAPYFERVDAIRPAIAELVALCRRTGVEVIHARIAELTRDSRDAGPRQRAFGLRVPRGSADAEIVPEAAPIDDEIVLDRSGGALFPTTNAERLLRNLGIRTVLIAGTSIDGGIEATIRNAADHDWNVVLVEDAGALFWHLAGLKRMEGGLTNVMTVADLAAALTVGAAPG